MEVKLKGHAVNPNQDPRNLARRYTPPDLQPQESTYGGLDIAVAGQLKHNPIVAGVNWASNQLAQNYKDDPTYQTFADENLDHKAGYPADLFVGSRSRDEDMSRMTQYDQERYVDDILSHSGAAGVVSSIAGGMLNPLYLVPILGWGGRSMSAGQRFYAASTTGAGVEMASEALLHQFQDTRTLDESTFNILAGSMFAGVLGSVIPARMPADELETMMQARKRLTAELEEADGVTTGEVLPESDKFIVQSMEETPDVDRIGKKTPFGIRRKLAKLTPMRVLASPNKYARRLGAGLGEQTVVGTDQAAIETLMKQYDAPLYESVTEVRKLFDDMRRSTGEKMTYRQFEEAIAGALRRNDTAGNPFVEQGAKLYRSKVLEPIRKEAVELGLIPDTTDVKFAKSYFPRIYNFRKLETETDKFVDHIGDWLYQTEMLDGASARETAIEVYQKLTHRGQNESLPRDVSITVGPLKGRTLAVPDEVLEPWLISEPEMVLKSWIRDTSAQITMTRKYGDTSLQSQLDEVDKEWVRLIAEAGDDTKKVARLNKLRDDDMEVLRALRDRIMSRYRIPDNPNSMWVRAGRMARNLNIVRLLGGMTLSAFPDMARPLYNHGLASYAKAIAAYTKVDFRNYAQAELRRIGVGLDKVLSHRLRSIAEQDYMPASHGTVEGVLDRMVSGKPGGGMDYGTLSLMTPWNVYWKTISGIMSQDGLIAHVMKPEKFAKKLAKAGIDGDMARRIRDQYKKHGVQEEGLRMANSDLWDDKVAAQVFETSVLREVDAAIVTPGIMDRPLWMSSEMGKLIGQLKSFGFASTNKQLLSGVNNFDAHFIQGIVAAVTLGALTYRIKRHLAGQEPDDDPMFLLKQGITYSGAIGLGSELMDLALNAGQAVGLYKGDGNYRWAKQGMWGALLGPSAGLLEDSLRGGRVFFKDVPTGSDADALRRVLPYQNLFYVRQILDRVQYEAEQEFGVERR